MCIMCATCCKINCPPSDNKPGTGPIGKNEGRETFEETLGNFTQEIPPAIMVGAEKIVDYKEEEQKKSTFHQICWENYPPTLY